MAELCWPVKTYGIAEGDAPSHHITLQMHLARWLRDPHGNTFPAHDLLTRSNLVRTAIEAGLAGLVLEQAARHQFQFGERDQRQLQLSAAAVGTTNRHQMRELERIVAILDRVGIPVILLKGAALHLTVYDRIDTRPMSDVDLLVRPRHAKDAVSALIAHGCRRGAALLRDDFFPAYYYETELFTDSEPPVRIDLHARPFRPLRYSRIIPDDALWHNARVSSVGRALAYVPEPEAMWVHLAAHAAFHGCSRLIWLYDLVRVAERAGSAFDWSRVISLSQQWHLSAAVKKALIRAAELFGPISPTCALDELASHYVNWRDRWTLAQAPRDTSSPASHVICNLFCSPGLGFRLGYLRSLLTPDRRHLGGIYPYRHFGWPIMGTLWRFVRPLARMCIKWRRRTGNQDHVDTRLQPYLDMG